LEVYKDSKAEDILQTAVQQTTMLDCNFAPGNYTACYTDGRMVEKLPGSDVPFTLSMSKEETTFHL